MGNSRIVGIVLIGGGAVLGVVGGLWLVAQISAGALTPAAALVGVLVGLLILLPMLGIGIALIARGAEEADESAERQELRKILDMVEAKGQVQVRELVLELGSSRDEVHDAIHSLVGMGLFSGYINWEEGTLYSSEASNLRGLERCNHCGGEVKFAGKGVMTCPYCGTEYFLN